MTQTAVRQITRAWILLVLLTLPGLAATHSGWTGLTANALILAAAVSKGRWMLMDFLKLRDVPSGWRIALSLWLILVTALAWISAAVPLLHG